MTRQPSSLPADWSDRRRLFDDIARLYDATRPGYPAGVLDRIAAEARAGGAAGDVFEVGCGTGQATLPLAERGLRVVAIDRGRAMAEMCAAKAAAFPRVQVSCAELETFDPAGRTFDLFLAAQCFHWTDRRVALDRVAALLRPGGAVALAWSVDRSEGTDFWRASQAAYDRWLPNAADEPPACLADLIAVRRDDLERHAAFGPVAEHRETWEQTWAAAPDRAPGATPRPGVIATPGGYVDLLRTHSPVRALPEADREAFLAEIAAVAARFGGRVTRRFETVLFVARRAAS